MAKQQGSGSERRLRVALIWEDAVIEEHMLEGALPVVLGGPEGVLPLPQGVVEGDSLLLLEPSGQGFSLRLTPDLAGAVWLSGERRDVTDLRRQGGSLPLGPSDYGIVTLGSVAVFFQYVQPTRKPVRPFFAVDGELAAGFGLSAFLFAALLLLAFLDLREHPVEDPLELPADLIAKFLVTPPPEDLLEQARASGTETEDPGLRGREEMGGKRHEGDEGRVGDENAQQEDTHIQGEVTDRVTAKVRNMGLLGALSGGGEGNAIADALDVPTVSDILGGMGAAPTVVGRGSRGAGLRGVGGGGGGDGPGSLFGAGNVGTGIGAGRGGGVGRGKGGVGVAGRKAERRIAVSTGRPATTGQCSAAQIQRTVQTNQAAIRYCYEVEVQRQPNLKGRVEITWRINTEGGVSSARVGRSTLGNGRVEGCVVRQVRRWRFAKPEGGECLVTYPFIFGVSGG